MKKEDLRVLIACEESQTVCKAFRDLGIGAFSCDLKPGKINPDWHFQCDVFEVINKEWDLMIAFPPCTDLAVSGARWFPEKIADGRQKQSIDFFMSISTAKIKYKAIENPIGIMSNRFCKPSQIIQPWMFGHGETKATCLWLFYLPKLLPTNVVEGREQRMWKLPPSEDRAELRSKTFPGIADAMANQWSNYLLNL